MLNESDSAWTRYALAVLAVAAAILVRAIFVSLIGSSVPYITFFPAILFAALYGGYRAGSLAAALAMSFVLFWVNPRTTFDLTRVSDLFGYILFIGTSALIIWLCERVRRSSFEAAEINQKNSIILESISDAFFAVDFNWRFIYVNKKAEEFLRKSREELIGRNLWETFPEAKNSVFDELYHKVMEERTPLHFEAQSTINQKWIGVNAYPAAEGLSVYSRDITAQKQAEKEREDLLQSEKEARQTAESANRLKDEFLATVSHELRTPLNSILGWASMAKEGSLPPERIQQALEIIERNAKSQNKIIEDILDVSRIVTGKLNLHLDSVKLVPVIEAALESVRPAAEARRIRIQTRFESGKDAAVYGDANRLQQIVWNLLSNAVKFTPEGGTVKVELKQTDHHLEISVRDSGEGIEPEFLPFVFERFRQAEGGTNRRYGGLGLGLAIVRHLTELHGGSVSVESEGKGKGATFIVQLSVEPVSAKDAASFPIAEKSKSKERSGLSNKLLSGKRILVVDDEPDAREIVSFILSNCGAQVETADSASAALEKLNLSFPDIMISDIGMPETDGFDLMRQIKETHPQAMNLKTIALTAYARKEDEQKALSAGFHCHLPKPLQAPLLIKKVYELTDEDSQDYRE